MATSREITSNASTSKSLGDKGQTSYSLTRSFRIILGTANEAVNYENITGVYVGAKHPQAPLMICRSYEARYDGDSRMSQIVTFQYEPLGPPEDDHRDKQPDIRPANWSVSTATYESPVTTWKKRIKESVWQADWEPAVNVVGDMYDGITDLRPLVRITISQWEPNDPTRNCGDVGVINSEQIKLGSLTIEPHQLMFMGVNQTAAVETWNDIVYRGWRADYEFCFKRNRQTITIEDKNGNKVEQQVDIGWDMAVPQTGWNVFAFTPGLAQADEDVFGQPLQHGGRDSQFALRIPPPPYKLPEGVNAGDKVRAMVRVFSYQNGGTSQSPSAQPIPIKDNGKPLKVDMNAAVPVRPIVYAYQVHDDVNITNALKLRLF